MGGGNYGFFNKLGVTDSKPYYEGLNAMDGDIIYHLYDTCHVLKRLRDNALDHGFIYQGTLLNKEMFERLLEAIGKSDLRVGEKLTDAHVNVRKQDRDVIQWTLSIFSILILMPNMGQKYQYVLSNIY